jgi:lipoyl(octanoyl) transferase
VGDAKIAALGLRIRKGCCYHGLSLNVPESQRGYGSRAVYPHQSLRLP